MDLGTTGPRAAILVILVVSLASGPLVPFVDFTQADTDTEFGQGTATLEVVSWPETAVIEGVGFGGDVRTISMEPARIRVTAVEGEPIVIYTLRIPELNYTRSTVNSVSPAVSGQELEFAFLRGRIDRVPANRSSVPGVVEIAVRNQTGKHVVAEHDITIRIEDANE